MASSAFPKRIFQKTCWLGTLVVVIVIALASFPQPVSGAADCPAIPIKGSVSLFMKGSYTDVQFGKNPDLQKNAILRGTIAKTILKPPKMEGFPYSGPNSSNRLFVFDLGCNPPEPLT